MKKSRKDDVIYTANCIIRKVGYSNLSFSQIAKSLEVTRENVHHYFKKKEALGNACLEVMATELQKKFDAILQTKNSSINKLDAYFCIYKTQQSEREDCPLVSLLAEFELLPLSMQEQVKHLAQIEQEHMQAILEVGIKQKEFKKQTCIQTKARQILSLLKGAVAYNKLYNNFDSVCHELKQELIT